MFLIAILVPVASAADAVKIGTSFESPAAGDGLIAWAATSGSCIKVLNADTGERSQIPTASLVSHVTAGGKWVAWYDSRILSVYNMDTQKVNSITDINISSTPVISGNEMVYGSAGNIYRWDLSTGMLDLIAEGDNPSIFGDILVYEKDEKIVFENSSSNLILTRPGSSLIRPQIGGAGEKVVFSDDAQSLFVYDLGTRTTTEVAKKVYSYDTASGDVVVYSQKGYEVYAYNLSSGVSIMLNDTQKDTQDSETAAQVTVSEDGSTAVWRFVKNAANSDNPKAAGIYMMETNEIRQSTDPNYTYINV